MKVGLILFMKYFNLHKILKATVTVVFLIFLFTSVDISVLGDMDIYIGIEILLGVLITFTSIFFMSVRWNILCSKFCGKTNVFLLYKYYLIGAFYNIFLPGAIGGDVVRTKKMMNSYGVKLKKATSLTVVERFSGVYVLFLVLVVGGVFFETPEGLNLTFLKEYRLIILLFTISLIPLLVSFLNKKITISYTTVLPIIVLSFIGQMGDVSIAWLLSSYFDLDIEFYNFLIIMPLVYFAIVLPISLGGIGVREGVFVGMLSLYGVATSTAVIISFLMYFIKVLVGAVGWIVLLIDSNQKEIKNLQ